MSPSHTPEPWRVINASPRADNTTAYLLAEHPWENSEANTNLLEAAPGLLAALEGLLRTCELNLDDMEPETREAIKVAAAAIAKAKGVRP